MTDAILTASGVSKSYDSVPAVRDLSFEAFPGDIVGLLGPNGAGKTTAIRVLTTIFSPSEGEFSVNGIPHTSPSEIRQCIGVLPENAGYPENMTGERYLRYYARLFGQTPERARSLAASLLAEVGLSDRALDSIAVYSRGMRQRLGMARALVNEPQVIFLDEPTLGLDPAGQRQVLRLIQDIAHERGATVILSTHFLDEVEEVCSRVIILNKGKVVVEGTIEDVKRKVAGPRTARFKVPTDLREPALVALRHAPGVASAQLDGNRRGWLTVTLAARDDDPALAGGRATNGVIQAIINAGIPLLTFDGEGARLSDAFLTVTGEAGDGV
jgi:ABC-2 type transport system ATP-binding protein